MALRAGETRRQELANDQPGQLVANDASAEREDVHVVILHALARREGIVTHARTDAADLGRGDRRADAAATHENAPIGFTGSDRATNGLRAVRIVVARHDFGGTAVHRFMPKRRNLGDHAPPEWPPSMVGCKGDSHAVPGAAARRAVATELTPRCASFIVRGRELGIGIVLVSRIGGIATQDDCASVVISNGEPT